MNNRFLSLLAIVLGTYVAAIAQNKRGMVADAVSKAAVEYASVLVTYSDSTTEACQTDTSGYFVMEESEKYISRIDVTAIGYNPFSKLFSSQENVGSLEILLQPSAVNLNEVVVKARRQLAKVSSEGLTYDMKNDSRVKGENLLTALNMVPFVETKSDGTVTVKGSSDYIIYINGRRDETAQNATRTVLSSLKATDIDHVDVITNGSQKYGVTPGTTILNICTREKSLDGYTLSAALGGNTQPGTNDQVTFLARKKNFDISLDYQYNLNGQRHQPFTQDYQPAATNEGKTNRVHMDANGNGDVQKHTLRVMAQWRVDSVNQVYADVHGNLRNVNSTATYNEYTGGTYIETYKKRNGTNSGTIEANAIWRNYYKSSPDRERITVGYRYAYNPDRRHYYTSEYQQEDLAAKSYEVTNGGLSEHSLMGSYVLTFSPGHLIVFTAKGVFRHGSTCSVYNYDGQETTGDEMNYNMQVGQLSAYYNGSKGKFYWGGGARLEQSHINMVLPQQHELDYKRNNTNLLPYVYTYFIPNNKSQLALIYQADLTRPSISALNPFRSNYNDYTGSVGNPQLEPQVTHNVTLQLTQVFKNGVLALAARYSHTSNGILSYSYSEGSKLIDTYGNIANNDDLQLLANMQWSPVKVVSLSWSGSLGYRWLMADAQSLHQKEWYYTFAPYLTFYLPHNWNVKASYGMFKNLNSPWTTSSMLTQYSFNIGKSLMGGRLTLSVEINSPFQKYFRSHRTISLPSGYWMQQTNFLTARSFGLNVYYSLHKGKSVDLKRDRTLKSSDMQTGVQ